MKKEKLTIEDIDFEIVYINDLLISTSGPVEDLLSRLNYLKSLKREMESYDD